jgi:hypothetical protein
MFMAFFQPNNIVAGKKYPIIDYIYPGPQGGSVGAGYFLHLKAITMRLLNWVLMFWFWKVPAIHIVQNRFMI